jgi:hypothetical protein
MRFSAHVQTGAGAHPTSYTMDTGSFPGVKRPGRGVDHPPHLAPKLKKEYSYTSTPPLGLRGLFQGEVHLYVYILLIALAILLTALALCNKYTLGKCIRRCTIRGVFKKRPNFLNRAPTSTEGALRLLSAPSGRF